MWRATTPADTKAPGTSVALVGGPGQACVATAENGRISLVYPVERWRRTRGADLTTPDDIREALARAGLTPQTTPTAAQVLTPSPSVAELLGTAGQQRSPRAAYQALGRLYAGGSCLLVLSDDAVGDGAEIWRVEATTADRLSHTPGPSLDRSIAGYCQARGLDHLSPSQVEALARSGRAEAAVTTITGGTRTGGLRDPDQADADVLAAAQQLFAQSIVDALARVSAPPEWPIVLVGRLFRNSFYSTTLARATPRECIVPPDPGGGGLAVGVLAAEGLVREIPSPFAGPAFDSAAAKLALDGCKLHYHYPGDHEADTLVVNALRRGRLVAWFEGGMEWGPRALGHRSILADATNPYVLENLNVYLKKRPPFMSYALSIRAERASEVLSDPRPSPHMQFESPLCAPARLPHFLRQASQPVRYQTVQDTPAGLSRLLRAFEQATSTPYLVNTSFNAVTEPIVATPHDAIRCFFGSGLDVLVMCGLVVVK